MLYTCSRVTRYDSGGDRTSDPSIAGLFDV